MALPRGGVRPPKDAPALAFASFHQMAAETYPDVNYLDQFTNEGMLGNDTEGDCVPVDGWAQARGLITAVLTGNQVQCTLDQVIALYKTQNPDFDPNGTASTNGPGSSADGGMDIQTLLEYLHSLGPDSEYGHLVAFAKVDHTKLDEVKAAISVFGCVVSALIVTDTQMQEFPGEWTWDPNGTNPGGHCTLLGGHDANGIDQATWGTKNRITNEFWTNAGREAWVCLWAEYLGSKEFMSQMDMASLASEYQRLTGDPFPAPAPAPTPAPGPTPTPSPVPDPTPTPQPEPPVTAPNAPTITSPVSGDTTTSPVTVNGTTDSDGSVVIYDGSATVGTAAAVSGAFSSQVDLGDGSHDLWATLTDGNGTSTNGTSVTITVNSAPAPAPTPGPTPDPTPGPTPDPQPTPDPSPVPPTPTPTPTPPPVVPPSAPVIERPGPDEKLTDGAVVISGTSDDPGASVSVFNGARNIAQASVDDQGNWSTEAALINGDYTITAQVADAGRGTGATSDPVSFSVEVDPNPTPAPPSEDPDQRFADFLRRVVFHRKVRSWEGVMELEREAQHWLDEKGL